VPEIWAADASGPVLPVKVLSYNLFWWNLFGIQDGLHGMAGKLIAGHGDPPFDLMGFQECEDPHRVLVDAGLDKDYETFQGEHSICMAFRRSEWNLLSSGQADVAEDLPSQYFGKRAAQWMRLRHHQTGKLVLFMNHHGPLPVNSGGVCGGVPTAHNLMKLMATHGHPGDALILVGDFNQGPQSETVLELQKHLSKVFAGVAMGGIDNIFTNVRAPYSAAQNCGNGGSDHQAISAIVQLGAQAAPPAPPKLVPGPVLPNDRGACSCQCVWAFIPGGCRADDGSCCWLQCCRSSSTHVLELELALAGFPNSI